MALPVGRFSRPSALDSRPAIAGQPLPVVALVLLLAVVGAAAVLFFPPLMVLGAILLLMVAGMVFRWPVIGAYAIIIVKYTRPGEIYKEWDLLHIERVVYVIVLTVLFLHMCAHRERVVRHPVTRALLALLGAMAIGIPVAYWPALALTTTYDFIVTLAAVFILVQSIRTEKELVQLVYIFIFAVFVISLRTLGTYNGGRAYGPSSEFGNSNEMAALMGITIPFAVFLASRHRAGSAVARVLLGLSLVAMAVVCVVTNSRAGTIALLAAGLMMCLRSHRRALALLLMGAVLASSWVLMGSERRERILSIRDREEDASYLGRVYAWGAARRMFATDPVLGVGAGNFPAAYLGGVGSTGPGRWLEPHNVYYQVLSELGLVGVICFAMFIFVCFRTLRRARRAWAHVRGSPVDAITNAAEIALVVLLVSGWAGHNLYRFYYYFIAALAVIVDRLPLPAKAEDGAEAEP